MTFKRAVWRPIAAVLSVVNLVAVGFAAGANEPWHATAHVGLALGFGWWAQRLGQSRGEAREDRLEPGDRIEELEAEMSDLRRELGEAQERLDFAERLLAKEPESRRMGPER